MRILFKYLMIILLLFFVFQICLFAQSESKYLGKYVKVIMKDGASFSGEVITQMQRGIQLEFLGGGLRFIHAEDIKEIKITTKEAIERENRGKNIVYPKYDEEELKRKREAENRAREADEIEKDREKERKYEECLINSYKYSHAAISYESARNYPKARDSLQKSISYAKEALSMANDEPERERLKADIEYKENWLRDIMSGR